MQHILEQAKAAKKASYPLACMGANEKNVALLAMANALDKGTDAILAANALDVKAARAKGTTEAMIDRLSLSEKRIAGMAQGLRDVTALRDPVGEILHGSVRPNGLAISKQRVPLGVIGIIYEARPNVTSDAAGLCIKTGNAVVLRGGSDAIHSNQAIVDVMAKAAYAAGLPHGAIQLIADTSREAASYMMGLNGIIDVLIPRGGAGLIQSVVKNATIPVIETGTGNCHVFVDASADLDMAVEIIYNAKTSRPSVCNAAETLLVHVDVANTFLPLMAQRLSNVEMRGCERTRSIIPCKPATEEDYDTEFLDYILAVKVMDSLDEAIGHINTYGTKHSEAIVTRDYASSERFLALVDAAAVYVNASTRFTDGGEFGFGAEIGISTQKLHARGPMGLEELTTYKYIIRGNGQVR